MKMKLGFVIIIIALFYHSTGLSQSKIELIPTSIFSPNDLITFKNRLYLTAFENGLSQRRPYVSDGTTAGTRLLKNITIPEGFNDKWIISGDKMFFIANDSINGTELWVTDGTENGTSIVKNISPKDTSTAFGNIHSLSNGKVYFSTSTNQPLKVQLWVSDGTESGTYSFFNTPTVGVNTAVYNSQMFYYLSNELWITDGTTTNGSRLLKNLREPNTELGGIANSFVATPQKFFFSTFASNGFRLWVSDGTPQGTFIPDTSLVGVSYITQLNNKVYFMGTTQNPFTQGLWISDGTKTGTKFLKKITAIRHLTILNNKLLFASPDSVSGKPVLWTSDGTEIGTFIIRNDLNITLNPPNSTDFTIPYYESFYTLKNKAYFFADRMFFTTGELYETDGTTNGTDTLRSYPQHRKLNYNKSNAAVLNDKLYLGLKEEIRSNLEYQIGLYVISNPVSKIDNIESLTDIKIYPTTITDWLFVVSETYKVKKIRILDLIGHVIYTKEVESKKIDIPLSNLTNNTYLIQIETESGTITKKFFKM